MLTAFYMHRLPADYDTGIIHARARQRGALWDDAPDLHFKAFLLREAGRFGATENNYASLYLWRHDAAFSEFIVSGRYGNVTRSFGRAGIHTASVLDARAGASSAARFAYLEAIAIHADADLDATLAREIDRNREQALMPGVVASIVSLDARHWTITRMLLAELEPGATQLPDGIAWQILHLARPLLHTLEAGVAA
jgi:hypothetical protein